MKITQQFINELRIYDTVDLEKLIHAIKDELNERTPYKLHQIAFIYEKEGES